MDDDSVDDDDVDVFSVNVVGGEAEGGQVCINNINNKEKREYQYKKGNMKKQRKTTKNYIQFERSRVQV